MAVNTLITIKDALTQFVEQHEQIQRIEFEADDHRAPVIESGNTFPVMFVAPISVGIGNAVNTHRLKIYIYEKINDSREFIMENANDTSLMLRDIRVWWGSSNYDSEISIIEDVDGEFLCDRELDNLVGYFAFFDIEIPSHGRCEVPVNVSPTPPPTCKPATYTVQYADGTVIETGTIPSGGSKTIVVPPGGDATWTLVDEDGNTLDTGTIEAGGSAVIEAPNGVVNIAGGQIEVLSGGSKAITHEDTNGDPVSTSLSGTTVTVLDLPCEGGVTRKTAKLMQTGQITSNESGDDGDIQAGRNFYTLSSPPINNNGNPTVNTTTNRFTDELGGQDYANSIVIDWSTWDGDTVLAYHKDYNLNPTGTKTELIAFCASLVLGSYSGWRLSNRKEISNICNDDVAVTPPFNYPPFNLSSLDNINTSTLSNSGTPLGNFYFNPSLKETRYISLSWANGKPLPVRDFTASEVTNEPTPEGDSFLFSNGSSAIFSNNNKIQIS